MKIKNTIFVLGAALAVSFGVFCSSKSIKIARADGETDLGTITFSQANADSLVDRMYGINWTTNEAPAGWDSAAFSPVDENSGTFVNGTRVGTEIKKVTDYAYYIPVPGGQVNTVATVKGTWSNGTYKFTVNPFTQRWTGTKWVQSVELPELDPYEVVTLSDTGFDDKDRESFDSTGLAPSAWNCYPTSAQNTRNSFAFKFLFEAYDDEMADGLVIKVGNSGSWDSGHSYRLVLNNTWGPQGVMFFGEYNGSGSTYRTSDIEVNLKSGARHEIEFGSIYVLDSEDTYNYVIFDGQYMYEEIRTPYNNLGRTAKIGYYYPGTDIFFGSAGSKATVRQIVRYNHLSENKQGIYLDGAVNSIPASWDTKGVPASKFNALYNGQPMYQFGTDGYPMAKPGDGETNAYYLDISVSGHTLQEGDVITLSDDFNFYYSGKSYRMSMIPFSMEYTNNQMRQIDNLNNYLIDKVSNHCNPDYYDDDKLAIIDAIIDEAENELAGISKMKTLWDEYFGYIAQLDAVPYNEEKAKEILDNAKVAAKAELNALVIEDLYDAANLAIVQKLVNDAITEIELETTDTVAKVEAIVADTKTEVSNVKTKIEKYEEEIMKPGNDIPDAYLADYEVITTTDFGAVGDLEFHDPETGSYSSGSYDDTTTRYVVGENNPKGNIVLQFNYWSDNPAARYVNDKGVVYGSHIFIRMRGNDRTAYRFDIATDAGEGNVGVALSTLKNDIAVDRIIYKAGLVAETTYKIECGAIDLDGDFNRTFLFMRINGVMVIKTIVDSIEESRPVIRIMDSFVQAPYYAKMSPVEEGTTKGDYAKLLGRPSLDASSNKNALTVSFRNKDIAVGDVLYPAKAGAFLLNGNEVASYRAKTTIEKISEDKYQIKIDGHQFEDGDVIKLNGLFSLYNVDTSAKTIYEIYETTLTYSEATDSWSLQGQTDLIKAKEEAKATIANYADESDYSEQAWHKVDQLVDTYKEKINQATTIEQVNDLIDEALLKIDGVNTLLDDYKYTKKEELTNYRSPDLYRAEEKATLQTLLSNAFAEIDGCNDELSIDLIVQQTKLSIDDIKTAAERDAEDLVAAKGTATTDVQSYASKIEMERYSDENADLLESMTYQALDDIQAATTIEQVNEIVSTYKEAVKEVKTKDGSRFDGDKYINKKSGGCGGSIATASTLSIFALLGLAILLTVRKTKEN